MVNTMIMSSSFAFVVSSFLLYFFYPKAIRLGFVDKADHRKLHTGSIPVIGGPVMYLVMVTALLIHQDFTVHTLYFILCSGILMLLGGIDDKKSLNVKSRLLLMIGITAFLYYFSGLKIVSLGDLVSLGDVYLDHISLFFTIVAVIGAITAFNMVDGLDGLLGGLSVVTFGALSVLFALNGQLQLASICICLIAALLPFLLCNLSLLPGNKYKVFMGDSGSVFIGFTVICLLVMGSQSSMDASNQMLSISSSSAFNPVTTLWIIAIPLMDMAANILRRLKEKKSPFAADRGHIHHILQRIGLSDLQVLIFLIVLAVAFAAIGIVGELFAIPEWIMLSLFLVSFAVYFYLYSHSWKVRTIIHRLFGNQLPNR